MRKTRNYNEREKVLIYKFFTYLEDLRDGKVEMIVSGETAQSLVTRLKRICGVSERTIWRILSDAKSNEDNNLVATLKNDKTGPKENRKTRVDQEHLCELRQCIYNHHLQAGRLPTIDGLRENFASILGYTISAWSVRKIMNQLGFRFIKSRTNRLQLIENPSIIKKRNTYLESMSMYRAAGRSIIYIDETYVHVNYSTPKSWSDYSSSGFQSKIGKGSRFIIG